MTTDQRSLKARESGSRGEKEVVRLISCPNCSSRLTALPKSFPLFDVQCTRCLFRAQIKTARCPPKGEVFGSGWAVLDKQRKVGHLLPPLILYFQWREKQRKKREVYFFPFLTMDNIRRRQRSHNGSRPLYREFNYTGLFGPNVPMKRLYPPDPSVARRLPPTARRARPSGSEC